MCTIKSCRHQTINIILREISTMIISFLEITNIEQELWELYNFYTVNNYKISYFSFTKKVHLHIGITFYCKF